MSNAYKPVRDLIGKYESRGDYNIVYGGIPARLRPAKLTDMTVGDVIAWQRAVVNQGAASSAAGKYQIIRKTLESLNFPADAKFNEYTQDAMGDALLDRRGFKSFLTGKKSIEDMAIDLAKEWASFPVPKDMRGASRSVKKGQSYYSGDGLNTAHASVDEVYAALNAARREYVTRPATKPPVYDAVPTSSATSGKGIAIAIGAIFAAVAAWLGFK